MTKTSKWVMALPYALWLVFFVIAPLALIGYQSFFNANGQFSLANYSHYFGMATYIKMTINSIVFAGIITLLTLLVAYPCAYFLTKAEKQSLWILLLILPTWINILLKAYAFIGIFSQSGPVNEFLSFVGIGPQQILFTHTSFIVAAAYIELPFMILPIYNALMAIDPSYEIAARDLGANRWQTLRLVTIPLSMSGVKAGVQAIFIPSLSLFMLTRLIGGNRVITLGTAVEQQFLVAENWGMGSTIGVVLILAMVIFMALSQSKGGSVNGQKKE